MKNPGKKGGAVIAVLAFIAVIGLAFHKEDRRPILTGGIVDVTPLIPPDRPAPATPIDPAGPNLPPVGRLPSLQMAMQADPALRRHVDNFLARGDHYLFTRPDQVDRDVAAILLLWAGADLNRAEKTAEGVDVRVDQFLRAAYVLDRNDPVVNQPRLGSDAWGRLFAYYKIRLMAQARGGGAPFTGTLTYDPVRDRLQVDGQLSAGFFRAFAAYLEEDASPARARAHLTSYVMAIYGTVFTDQDKALLSLLD